MRVVPGILSLAMVLLAGCSTMTPAKEERIRNVFDVRSIRRLELKKEIRNRIELDTNE